MFKDNSSSLAPKNEIIIGNNFYRILKSFSNIVNNYNFINNGEFKVTENIGYPTYNIKRRVILCCRMMILTINTPYDGENN